MVESRMHHRYNQSFFERATAMFNIGTSKVSAFDTSFVFVRIKLDGRITNISIDPLLAEILTSILGNHLQMTTWIGIQSRSLYESSCDKKTGGGTNAKRKIGLSRLVARSALRFITMPTFEDIEYLHAIKRTHPLRQAPNAETNINTEDTARFGF
jgi:hypothetical protein